MSIGRGLIMTALGWKHVVHRPEQCTDEQLEKLREYAEASKREMELFMAAIVREQNKRSGKVQAGLFMRALGRG